MIVPLYLLFTFGRDAILYVFNNFTRNMKRRIEPLSAPSISNKETNDKDLSNKENEKSKKKHDATDTAVIRDDDYDEETPSVSTFAIKSPIGKDHLYYNMNLKYRGKCIIFNHTNFAPGMSEERLGTKADEDAIRKTFSELDFNVKVHDDLTFSKINSEIYDLTQEDYTDHCCICIFVLTHGDANGILYSYNFGYSLAYIWKPFTADRCPSLSGKPKLFFIQACRGRNLDSGVPMCSKTETDSSSTSYKLPVYADFLIAHSTVEDHVSWRSTTEGSWYIQTLCKTIDTHWKTTDMLKMLTITSRTVATSYVSEHDDSNRNDMVQIPSFTSSLTRDLYFHSTN